MLTIVAFPELLKVIYNIADFVGKSAVVLACWPCAKSATEKQGAKAARLPCEVDHRGLA